MKICQWAILNCKLGQTDLISGVGWGFISTPVLCAGVTICATLVDHCNYL